LRIWAGSGAGGGGEARQKAARRPNNTRHTSAILEASFLFEKIQEITMPKLKTHKGASKRFKKTGTGKIVRNHAFGRHILTSKPHKRKKKLHQSVVADAADQPTLKRMLPY
jgi:large subunit ribosomal protein L35